MSYDCLNCSDRELYCHDSCKKYARMKQERQLINEKYRQYMDGRGYDGCLASRSKKTNKYAY